MPYSHYVSKSVLRYEKYGTLSMYEKSTPGLNQSCSPASECRSSQTAGQTILPSFISPNFLNRTKQRVILEEKSFFIKRLSLMAKWRYLLMVLPLIISFQNSSLVCADSINLLRRRKNNDVGESLTNKLVCRKNGNLCRNQHTRDY